MPIFDPAIFDPVIFDTGGAAPAAPTVVPGVIPARPRHKRVAEEPIFDVLSLYMQYLTFTMLLGD